jgi:3-hydroxyisobutyrate dehydrogenase-like beta-hydroxyacid dehydrogenase
MTHLAKVGFIGLGDMGEPIAANLLSSGIPLMTRKSTRRLARRSDLDAAATNGNFSACNLVFLCLPSTELVRDTLFGTDGLLDTMPTGSTVVDLGTSSYSGTLEIAEQLQAKGLTFVDAPISGMQARAEAGTLTVMCGCEEKVFNDLLPVLSIFGETVLHMGGVGAGQLTKLINQLLFDINAAAMAEILPFGAALGLDPEKMARVVNTGTGRSYASEFFIPRILQNSFSDGYALQSAYKDLVHAGEISMQKSYPLPVLAAATSTYQQALLKGLGDLDKGAMIKVFEDLLNVQVRANNNANNRLG